MRISTHYHLPYSQGSLEFVDVDSLNDTKLYIDPRAIKDLDTDWAKECVALMQNFFTVVIREIQAGRHNKALLLLRNLSEPNETRLGLSKHRARGRAVGEILSEDIWDALTNSEAARSGLLEDLEDTALLIDGIGYDLISDMTTNIIRSQLIKFTEKMMKKYPQITTEQGIFVGPIWDRHQEKWLTRLDKVPVIRPVGPLLLVPKSIVRRNKMTFNPGEYLTHYILPRLRTDELQANSPLVEVLKSGERRVTKVSLKKKHGLIVENSNDSSEPRSGKSLNLEVTLEHPEILDEYRTAKESALPVLDHDEISEATNTPLPDWGQLLQDVLDVPTGRPDASRYHLAVEALFTALFYPALDFMKHEFPVFQGRKRIDITYTNMARSGFFDWVNRVVNAPAHEIYVECKNYTKDVGNPELDQIRGRFTNHSSNVGLMVFRSTSNKALIEQGCRDTALAGHGYIIALDDDDLRALVEEKKANPDSIDFQVLRSKYSALVS
jgi:hypothetical protein